MARPVTLLSWNVNGVRAVFKVDFMAWLKKTSPDVLCIQETKCKVEQLVPELLNPEGYHAEWNSAERPGYSGVATFSKIKPAAVTRGFGVNRFDTEGRVLETDHGDFILVNVYFPNGGNGPERLQYKREFYEHARSYFARLRKAGKGVIVCGDFNIAHNPVDVYSPGKCAKVSGFLPEERVWLDRLLEDGFIDAFREFDPSPERYTWWDQRTFARSRNDGWRIDLHLVSKDLRPRMKDAFILPDVLGSDHCPVGLKLSI